MSPLNTGERARPFLSGDSLFKLGTIAGKVGKGADTIHERHQEPVKQVLCHYEMLVPKLKTSQRKFIDPISKTTEDATYHACRPGFRESIPLNTSSYQKSPWRHTQNCSRHKGRQVSVSNGLPAHRNSHTLTNVSRYIVLTWGLTYQRIRQGLVLLHPIRPFQKSAAS